MPIGVSMAFDVVDATSSEAPLSAVQARTLREIVAYIRREDLPAGTHLREWHLARLVGTSRSPVQAALNHLAGLGFGVEIAAVRRVLGSAT